MLGRQCALAGISRSILYTPRRAVEPDSGELELLAVTDGFRSDGANCRLDVLLLDGSNHIVSSQSQCCQAIRIHPDTHAIFKFSENESIADTP